MSKLTSSQRSVARTLIRNYLIKAEANKANIHYSMIRPTEIHAPTGDWATDCSGLCINAFHWADLWTKFLVKDPGGYGYTGIGNTGSILATNRNRRVPLDRKFFVGDMALFGPSFSWTKHVIICKKNGDEHTAKWTSHGQESGPYEVNLHYRYDLLCVVRSESLA